MTESGSVMTVFLVTRFAFGHEGEASRHDPFRARPHVPVRSFGHRPEAEAFIARELSTLYATCNPFRHARMTTREFSVRSQSDLIQMSEEAGVPAAPCCPENALNGREVLQTWWSEIAGKLSDEQVRQVWEACGHFGIFEVLELTWED